MTNSTPWRVPHVGLFDSGIGGLSVLRQLRAQLPALRCTYIADTRHAPYGGRPRDWLLQRCEHLCDALRQRGADLVVVACNTATTQVIDALRASRPELPFVGVEPGIKPAVADARARRIAVLATAGTIASPRLQALLAAHAREREVHLLACVGLADAVEELAAGASDAGLEVLLDGIAQQLVSIQADTVVLGCTHYPLVADRLARRLPPHCRLVDTADAVTRRIAQLLPRADEAYLAKAAPRGSLTLLSSGDAHALQRAVHRWLPDEAPELGPV